MAAAAQEINDRTELPIAGGLKAIHIPGQCAGQIALLWPAPLSLPTNELAPLRV
jgi:hypothetical protein